jgi:uncharacterized protein (TIGR02246 family)
LALLVVAAGSCTRAPKEDPASVRAAIVAANREFMNAFAANDAQALGLLFTEDAALLPPNAEPVSGRTAITSFWETLLMLPVREVRLETGEIYGAGDVVTEEGRYTLLNDRDEPSEEGKYLVVWKRGAQGWKLYRDLWNSNAPATAAAVDTTAAAPDRG